MILIETTLQYWTRSLRKRLISDRQEEIDFGNDIHQETEVWISICRWIWRGFPR